MFAEACRRVAELMQSEEFLIFLLLLFFCGTFGAHRYLFFWFLLILPCTPVYVSPQCKKTVSASVAFSEQRSLKSTVWFTNTFLSICFLFNLLPAMFLPQPHLLRLCKAG